MGRERPEPRFSVSLHEKFVERRVLPISIMRRESQFNVTSQLEFASS